MSGKGQNFTRLNNCKCLMTPRLKSLPWLHLCRQCSKEHANDSPAASWCLEFQNTYFNTQYLYRKQLADCIRIVFNRATHLHGTGYAVPWGLWPLCRSSGNSSSPFCQCQSAETWGILSSNYHFEQLCLKQRTTAGQCMMWSIVIQFACVVHLCPGKTHLSRCISGTLCEPEAWPLAWASRKCTPERTNFMALESASIYKTNASCVRFNWCSLIYNHKCR